MIVSAAWLKTHLTDQDIRIVDVRSYHGEPERGRSEYLSGHVPGAHFLDLETDLVGPGGGRHPLPAIEAFVATLESLGISRDHYVVVYDQSHGSTAARLWWMLRHVGHERVAVLDGGWQAWLDAGGPQTTETSEAEPSTYSPDVRTDDLASRGQVAKREDFVTLIDARAPARYRGEVEPIDPVAGRIPGAINIPYETLAREGTMLPPDELKGRLAEAPDSIAYCGSGVTACYVILAYAVAELPLPRLYPGSWSDWIDADMPVAP